MYRRAPHTISRKSQVAAQRNASTHVNRKEVLTNRKLGAAVFRAVAHPPGYGLSHSSEQHGAHYMLARQVVSWYETPRRSGRQALFSPEQLQARLIL